MKTTILYNYKTTDQDLDERIRKLKNQLQLSENDTLHSVIETAVQTGVDVETANRQSAIQELKNIIQPMQFNMKESIQTYTGLGKPSLYSYPASDWPTEEYRDHQGDLFFDKEAGSCYRFTEDIDTFFWEKMELNANASEDVPTEAISNSEIEELLI